MPADPGPCPGPQIRTPHPGRLATAGVRLTQFTQPAALCPPSRGSLLTGRYPTRTGLTQNLNFGYVEGIEPEEITLAEALKALNYRTAMVGKWGLGERTVSLPTRQGFESYFGYLYNGTAEPLRRDEKEAEEGFAPDDVTPAYTGEAVRIIRAQGERPFFLYLAHHAPHIPLRVSAAFRGRSPRGFYGDTVEELDWSVGEVVKALRETNLERRTLVLFTSDNGPWLAQGVEGGSAGPLFGGKGHALTREGCASPASFPFRRGSRRAAC